ncbi:MAG TPA: RNA polymerase sigma factor [Longimicrobiaceae bacterium]|nr:RNA polymerase sigma factor [Longimicrobiaceae bacterium]
MGEGSPSRAESGPLALSIADPSDATLARQVQRGDPAAFDLLVHRHMKRAFGVAFRLLGHAEDAEDLVQDAFIAALTKIDSYDSSRDFAPWFYRILVNRCLNARKARARRAVSELPPDAASSGPSPLAEAERSELRDQLRVALARLPDRQRTIVAMFDIEGFSSPEIAEMLGISDGTVRWHLHQARRVLREALEPHVRRQA